MYSLLKGFQIFSHRFSTTFSLWISIIASLHSLFTENTIFCTYSDEHRIPTKPELGGWFMPTLVTLGTIHLLLALWMVVEYFLTNLPHFKLPTIFFKSMYVSNLTVLRHDYCTLFYCFVVGNICLESYRELIDSVDDSHPGATHLELRVLDGQL